MDVKIIENLHTHTFRCKHAEGDVADYARAAIASGLSRLGMSDHTPLPGDWFQPVRMEHSELDGYVQAVLQARKDFPQLEILLGMECDYFPEYESYFREEMLEKYPFDYLIGSIHGFALNGEKPILYMVSMEKDTLKAYADQMIAAMESGLFAFIAHPDLLGQSIRRWSPEVRATCKYILEAAQSLRMPMEINVSGYEKARNNAKSGFPLAYPMEQFWEIAAGYDVQVLVSSDAHKPDLLTADLAAGYRLVEKYGLTLWDSTERIR